MKRFPMVLFVAGMCLVGVLPGFGMGEIPPFDYELVARAEVDECFNGIGQPYIPGPECAWYDTPKANQAYLWGLTKADDSLWFGTAANMLCLVRAFSVYSEEDDGDSGGLLSNVFAYENELWLCEYEDGVYPETEMTATVPDVFSDYRPPEIYTYDIQTRELTNMTGLLVDIDDRVRLENTFGLRSAAYFDGLVFLSGPVALDEGINMFVFDAVDKTFVGSATLPEYQNIRKWLVLDGVLYAAVAGEDGRGKVLRWTGSQSDPFSFVMVGNLDGGGAEIVAHNGRIYVGTWPDRSEVSTFLAGIWMSPVVPDGGLTEDHYHSWKKVWQTDEYEADPLNAAICGVGAMASFDGYLYWGTMHIHGKAALVFAEEYDISLLKFPRAYFNSWRASAVFRGTHFAEDKTVELLYGNSHMPVYIDKGSWGYWARRANNMGGISGKYGRAGFGNIYNNYIWTMAVYADELFVGTMDHSYLWLDWDNLQRYYIKGEYFTIPIPQIPWLYTPSQYEYGADLWRFPSANEAAERVSRDGLGNYTNYGFRSAAVDENTGLYLGTANPASIYADRNGNVEGGWELIRVYQQ